ncbi:response regulator [Pseudoalteromonas sp. MMG022]|uniref:response regulator n=1 Tax=Pseudoalteromonas sp. MMG022 TaxID=2909978 RepID=UPI001F0229BB|nr:response regulator [Pseudoalteromonas sp. MMG022]MCF6436173.1 response regulator [Pseudoalteromonas sp. MMG022]
MSRLKRLFRYRALGMFVACVVLLGIALIFILDSHTKVEVKSEFYNKLTEQLSLRHNLLLNQLDDKKRQIRFLHATPPVNGIMRAAGNNGIDPLDGTVESQWIARLKIIFKGYINNNPDILQLRYIGAADDGKELVRVERRDGIVSVVEQNRLQGKGHTSYFQAISKLNPGELYISDLNLNREFGKLDFPYMPTMRVAMPVFDQTRDFFGFVIINIKAEVLLKDIQQDLSKGLDLYLLNDHGDFKIHPDEAMTFGTDLGNSNMWSDLFEPLDADNGFSVAYDTILQQDILYLQKKLFFSYSGAPTFLKLVVSVPRPLLEEIVANRRSKTIMLVVLFTLVVVLVGAVYQNSVNKKNALLEAKYKYEAIVEGSSDAIVSMDLNGIVTSWNHAAQKIFGFREGEAINKSIYDLFVPPDCSKISLKGIQNLDEKLMEPFDIVAKDSETNSIDVSITLSPIMVYGKKLIGVAAIIRDIRVQKETQSLLSELNESLEDKVKVRTKELELARKKAVEANEAKSNFVANISHEIRTPMNAILGLTYLLQKQQLSPTVLNMVQKIHHAGENLLGIINDILDFSKIEAHRLDIECVPFQLADVMDNVANIMSSSVGDKPIEVIMSAIPQGAESLKGDPLRLGQVLINLTGNALKFTKRGEVVVGMALVNGYIHSEKVRIRFSVRDTGVGIPQEKQKAIFNAFSQVDVSTTRTFGGTGLGLTISKQLVSLMGGDLQLFSEEGIGSEFYFELTFPLSDPATNSMPHMLHQRILIADDHDVALSLIVDTAVSLGWRPESTPSGKGALDKLEKRGRSAFDVLLIDWRMPGIDGLSVAASIHEQMSDFDVPIILMVNAADREKLYDNPASKLIDAVITKPVTSSSLYNTLLEIKNRRGGIKNNIVSSQAKRVEGLTILVVDDNEINRMVAQNILSSEGAHVELAENGSMAFSILVKAPKKFDVILMDVQMPVMDGYAATREIKQNKELRDIPVIALTAAVFKADRDAAIQAGMNDFVPKPFDVEELIGAVIRCTKKQHQHNVVEANDNQQDENLNVPYFSEILGLEKWSDKKSYQSQLAVFLEHHENDIQRISDELDKDNKTEAKRLCHKLRGSAGALELKPLWQQATKLEKAIQVGNRDYSAQLKQLALCMGETIELVRAYLSENRQIKSKLKVVEFTHETEHACQRVLKTLKSDNPDEVENTLNKVDKLLPDELVGSINTCLSEFDFRRAETIVKAYINSRNS